MCGEGKNPAMNSCSTEISCHAAPMPSSLSCTLLRSPLIFVLSHRLILFQSVCWFYRQCPCRWCRGARALFYEYAEAKRPNLHPPSFDGLAVFGVEAHWPLLHIHLGAKDQPALLSQSQWPSSPGILTTHRREMILARRPRKRLSHFFLSFWDARPQQP